MKTGILSALIGCFMLTGCTGPFALTQSVHTWQTSFDAKWVDELAFLGCLPVYSLSCVSDVVILNSVEFWTGANPMDTQGDNGDNPSPTDAQLENGEDATVMTLQKNGAIRIDTDDQTCILKRTKDGVVAKDATGKLLYKSSTHDQLVKITDADGNLIKVFHKS